MPCMKHQCLFFVALCLIFNGNKGSLVAAQTSTLVQPGEFPFLVRTRDADCMATLIATNLLISSAQCQGKLGDDKGRVLIGGVTTTLVSQPAASQTAKQSVRQQWIQIKSETVHVDCVLSRHVHHGHCQLLSLRTVFGSRVSFCCCTTIIVCITIACYSNTSVPFSR